MQDFSTTDFIDLRILATTDIHMNLSGFDYFKDRKGKSSGLAGLARMIQHSRRTHKNCLLFDNGDMLQGEALGDYIGHVKGVTPDHPHPAIKMMNQMGYDAVTLGNHDFSFGTHFLVSSLTRAKFPVVSTNLRIHHSTTISNTLLLIRRFQDRNGGVHSLRIGVMGFLPPQTTDWNTSLRDSIYVEDILTAARSALPALQAHKPDFIVALAHSGIGLVPPHPRMENAATAVAGLEGIDVVIAGHIHRSFPSDDFPTSNQVDPLRGSLHGKPAVMAGFGGSHLGVVDLALCRKEGMWQVADFTTQAIPATQRDPIGRPSGISPAIMADHQATRRYFAQPVAHSDISLHSHFTMLGHDAGLELVNQAQAWHIRHQLSGTVLPNLPILSVSAPSRVGGRGGPSHYTQIPQGPLRLRHLADLYPFPNQIAALVVTGADLQDWLERAAGIFHQTTVMKQDQPLLNTEFPGYNFDVISGLNWQIDLTQPARFDTAGRLSAPDSHRISRLRHQGKPVESQDRFILAINSYRLSDCGLYAPLVKGLAVIHEEQTRIRDILHHYLQQCPVQGQPKLGFSLSAGAGTSAMLDTSPLAIADLDQIANFSPQPKGLSSRGFLRLQIQL